MTQEEIMNHLKSVYLTLQAEGMGATRYSQGRRMEAAALEQAIKVLEVLFHPDFFQLEDYGRPVDLHGGRAYISLQRLKSSDKKFYVGDTVLEAVLKAHEIIKTRVKGNAE